MKWIRPSGIRGRVAAPPSKSFMIRAVAAGLLAEGTTRIANPSSCDDARAALRVAGGLGALITVGETDVVMAGTGGPDQPELDCGESGLCLRMFAPIAALRGDKRILRGTGSLATRPMGMMEAPLRALGALCETSAGLPPVTVVGPLRGGKAVVDGAVSSQFLSGLLMALPVCPCDSELEVTSLASRPYVSMTLGLIEEFGVRASADEDFRLVRIPGRQAFRGTDVIVEGDWSGAAFLLVAAALTGGVEVTGLNPGSQQADRVVTAALLAAGARLTVLEDRVSVGRDRLDAFEFDASDCPDLFPPLAVLACGCRGRSRLRGVRRLAHKESDRASALVDELGKVGADLHVAGDILEITGRPLRGGAVDARGDHRIAMAGAIAGLLSAEGIAVRGASCVAKSYPRFFDDLESLGGDVS